AAGMPEEMAARWRRLDGAAWNPVLEAVESGGVVVVEPGGGKSRYPAVRGDLGGSGVLAVAPLPAGAGVLGALAFGFPPGHQLGDADHRLLLAGSKNCGVALERALLFERERVARTEAENATRLRDEVLSVVAHDL